MTAMTSCLRQIVKLMIKIKKSENERMTTIRLKRGFSTTSMSAKLSEKKKKRS